MQCLDFQPSTWPFIFVAEIVVSIIDFYIMILIHETDNLKKEKCEYLKPTKAGNIFGVYPPKVQKLFLAPGGQQLMNVEK